MAKFLKKIDKKKLRHFSTKEKHDSFCRHRVDNLNVKLKNESIDTNGSSQIKSDIVFSKHKLSKKR